MNRRPSAAGGVKPHRHPYGMPPPLIGAALAKRRSFAPCQGPPYQRGLSPQATGGLSRKQLVINPTVIPTGCHRTGCGSQRPLRARSCTCVLLAAAPTTPPCFRRWRRSSSLPSRGGLGKKVESYAMPRAPLLAGAVAVGDWGVKSHTFSIPVRRLATSGSKTG